MALGKEEITLKVLESNEITISNVCKWYCEDLDPETEPKNIETLVAYSKVLELL
jgi:hypothetical protein